MNNLQAYHPDAQVLISGSGQLAIMSELVNRAALASHLGQQYGGDRDIYSSCGYPKNLTLRDLRAKFERQDISKRIVKAMPDATWADVPNVYETEDVTETDFEKAWDALVQNTKLYRYLHRLDVVSGIGEYGILFLGFDDGQDPSMPIKSATTLLYVQPLAQDHAEIASWATDINDERFGLPEMYEVQFQTRSQYNDKNRHRTTKIHWSRVIHVAEDCTESDIYATPRLQAVYNRMMDLEKIVGGSGEMFWRGGFPGMSLEAPAGGKIQDKEALEDEIKNYVHKLTRVLRLKGMEAKMLTSVMESPEPHAKVQIWFISAATGIPMRILMGSERGELASSQDEKAWQNRIKERRINFVIPCIIRTLVERLVHVGVLPEPIQFNAEWDETEQLSEKEQATIAGLKADALAKYVQSGSSSVMTLYHFLTNIMNFNNNEAQSIVDAAELESVMEAEEAEADLEDANLETELENA